MIMTVTSKMSAAQAGALATPYQALNLRTRVRQDRGRATSRALAKAVLRTVMIHTGLITKSLIVTRLARHLFKQVQPCRRQSIHESPTQHQGFHYEHSKDGGSGGGD
jgi:hypothetical protein